MTDAQEYDAGLSEFAQRSKELLDTREAAQGRAPSNPEAAAAVELERAKFLPLASMHTLHGEARAEAAFDSMVALGMEPVASLIPNSAVIRKQFAIAGGKGRVDRAAFHADGRVSLIEIKDIGNLRDIVAGIGQAVLYKALLERTSSLGPIVPVLAVLGDRDADVARACELAFVEYLPLGDLRFLRTISQITAITVFGISVALQ